MDHTQAYNGISGLGRQKIKLGLERMRELMHLLGDPQDSLKFIHVAGTNGKGSTCSFISACLTAMGYRVGMYTSPAVEDVREQYTINGAWISEEDYAAYVTMLYSVLLGRTSEQANNESSFRLSEVVSSGSAGVMKDDMPTAFELETALAFCYFQDMQCDFVVLETGLGGSGDATNIVSTTVLSVLTSISEDHLGMIGNNLEEIARTKAGIIKPGVPVVMLDSGDTVRRVMEEVCDRQSSRLYTVNPGDIHMKQNRRLSTYTNTDESSIIYSTIGDAATEDAAIFDYKTHKNIELAASGVYQPYNAALALEALDILGSLNILDGPNHAGKYDPHKAEEVIGKVIVPFRMQKISDDPLFYLDGAHNPDAAIRLKETVELMFPGYKLIFIIGMFRDKDYRAVVRTMAPLASHIITVQTPDSSRALPAEDLRNCILEESKRLEDGIKLTVEDVEALPIAKAVNRSISLAAEYRDKGDHPCILAFGSLSYLKYIIQYLI